LRAVGLHADVIAVTSRAYAAGCVLVRNRSEAFCIDSPVFPDELEILPAIAEQAGFSVVGVLATHADWDTADGTAFWIAWARVLVPGDYLSPVEIPMIHESGSVAAYIATLNRLEPLVEQAEHVVPGHGGPIDGTQALAILREDRAYLEALKAGEDPQLPLARRTKSQRAIHER